jgi:hypothetical protein
MCIFIASMVLTALTSPLQDMRRLQAYLAMAYFLNGFDATIYWSG